METPTLTAQSVGSQRLVTAVGPHTKPGFIPMLQSFRVLQPGGWGVWLAIWLLQNVRFAPIYLLPLFTGKLIDAIDRSDPGKTYALMPLIIIATIGLCVANVVGDTTGRILLSRISRGLTASLRDALVRRLNRMEITFHDREHLGELQNRFTLDMNRLEAFLAFLADGLLMNATVILIMACIIIATNPLLVIVIAVSVTLNLLLARNLWGHLRSAQEAFRRAEGHFLHQLVEALRGLRMARAHATEEFVESRLRTNAREVARRGMALDFLINLFGSSSWAISTLLNTTVILFGVWLVVMPGYHLPLPWGHQYDIQPITLGQLTVMLSYYGIIAGALTAISNNVPTISGAHDSLNSLSELYRNELDEVPSGGTMLTDIRGQIELAQVQFIYPGKERPLFTDLSLSIAAGSSLALVGPSGGGKSTVASLILGFYRPQGGNIRIDGHDIETLDLRSVRRHVGVVSQDVVLFNDTILRNIAWGDRNPDHARAEEAARLANAWEFIEKFPGRMDQVLGDSGSGLSGGQKQRLAIARALYRDPRILILDEATSALDTASEKHVQVALKQAMAGRTTIIIAHRLSTIRDVDVVVVLAEGGVVQQGTYAELSAIPGPFAQLIAGSDAPPPAA